MLIGNKVYHFSEINSTNEYLKGRVDKVPEGTVVIADTQTAGKGRLGKQWYSPEGGLYLSILLKPTNITLISIVTSIAICETFNAQGILTGIKWPNDILLNGKKIAGILTEIVDDTVILGIGINLNIRKFPDDLAGMAISVFLETKKYFNEMFFFGILCRQLDDHYRLLQHSHISELLEKWRNYTIMLGRHVRIEIPGKILSGRVLDIDKSGALVIMLPNRKIERVIAGECRLIS